MAPFAGQVKSSYISVSYTHLSASIEAQGLLPQSRLYVHLSPDVETAEKVGRRHGEPVIYLVDAGQMHRDGSLFYLSANGVWLTKTVPAPYLKRLEE